MVTLEDPELASFHAHTKSTADMEHLSLKKKIQKLAEKPVTKSKGEGYHIKASRKG